jgi:hypothetical protein
VKLEKHLTLNKVSIIFDSSHLDDEMVQALAAEVIVNEISYKSEAVQ